MDGFVKLVGELDDPRSGNAVRYSMAELLLASLLAMICGAKTCVDIEDFARSKQELLREYLPYKNGTPSHDTFSRFLRNLDSDKLEKWFARFAAEFAKVEPDGDVYAVDGKTARRSGDSGESSSALHMINVWSTKLRMVLAQRSVDGDSNEIPAVREVLDMLDLKGATVTVDTMHCQRETARQIVDAGGDYLMPVKGNQRDLHEDLEWFMNHPGTHVDVDVQTTLEKDHGRIETRTASCTRDVEWVLEGHDWPNLKSVAKIERMRQVVGGEASVETVHYISSRPLTAEEANRLARSHWEIENSVHWVLDVVFDEDQARSRKDNAAANLAVLRKIVLNVVRSEGTDMGVQRKLNLAGWDNDFLRKLLREFG